MARASWMARMVAKVLPSAIQHLRAAQPAELTPRADVYASPSYSRSGGAKWPGGLSRDPASHILDHWRLRQQARDAVHDSQLARAIVDRWADSVVGTGLVLSPQPDAGILGMSPEQASEWSKAVAKRFHLWANTKHGHRSGTMTWYQSQYLYERSQHRDNDMFVRLFYSQDPALLNPLQWEVLDPNQIRSDAYTTTSYLSTSDDGIDRDALGRETRYRVWVLIKRNDRWEPTEVPIPRTGEKSGRVFMLHGYHPEYAGQGRGFSRIAHALQEFEDITSFAASEVQKAINQASIFATVESDTDNPSSLGSLADLMGSPGAGPQGTAYTPGAAAPTASEIISGASVQQIPEARVDKPGSLVVAGLDGKNKLKAFANTAPVASFDKFIDSIAAYLSAANGIPIEQVLMRFNSNYSASRACMVLFYRNCQQWRAEMAADYLDPVYEAWLGGEIASGRVACPGWADPVLRAAWLAARWVGSPMPNIDPKQTAEADKLYVEMGAQTLGDVARNLNGSDGEANRAQLVREYAELPEAPWAEKPAPAGAAADDAEPEPKQAPGAEADYDEYTQAVAVRVQIPRQPRHQRYEPVYDKATGKLVGVEIVTEPAGHGRNGHAHGA